MSAEQIDAEKLEAALRCAESAIGVADRGTAYLHTEWLAPLAKAARAHLSTLPRVKEVPVECWVLLTSDGIKQQGWTNCPDKAEEWSRTERGAVVRLTGTAKVRA